MVVSEIRAFVDSANYHSRDLGPTEIRRSLGHRVELPIQPDECGARRQGTAWRQQRNRHAAMQMPCEKQGNVLWIKVPQSATMWCHLRCSWRDGRKFS